MSAGRIMFGTVGLEVDTDRGHCTFHVRRRGPVGPVPHSFVLHGTDEIEGAIQVWANKTGIEAESMRGALRYARQALTPRKGARG